jgi:predicted metal-dependent hydrolase
MRTYRSSIKYGKEKITFDVSHADRKTMEIGVHPDIRVIVKAPEGVAPEVVKKRVARRARWIKKQIDYFRKFEPRTPDRCYVGGETHLFLGRQYRLKIRKHNSCEVKLKGGYFYVTTSAPNNTQKIRDMLFDWYKSRSIVIFSRRLEVCYEAAKKLDIGFPKLSVKKMSKRWGSCGKSGDIILNTELVKAPIYCIDYVIMHELCHLRVHTHNNEYYRLLSKYMPDWEKRKERLEKVFL